VLSDVQTNIHLDGVRGVTITGNTFWQGYAQNMLIENSEHVLVGPNMLERNPLYGYTSEGKCGVVFRECRDSSINGLHLHNVIDSEAGLVIDKCDRMHIVGGEILDCDNVGLLIRDSRLVEYANVFLGDGREGSHSLRLKIIDGNGNTIDHLK